MDKLYKYYAQNGEDYVLCNFFDFKLDGYFIDVGAFDGVHLSNTYCFELLGWKGICVEPQSFYYKHCKEHRPQTICVHAACTESKDIIEITLDTDATGLFSGVNIPLNQKNISDHYTSINKELPSCKNETVPATTLDTLLEKHYSSLDTPIDFISIDVEGFEMNVLKGFSLSEYSPRVLVIETNDLEEKRRITDYLNKFQYKFARKVGPNSFYVKSETDLEKIKAIEISCVIEKQMHPLGPEYTQQLYLDGKIIFDEMNGNSILKQYPDREQLIKERNQKVKQLLDTIETVNQQRKEQIKNLTKTIDKLNHNSISKIAISKLKRLLKWLLNSLSDNR